MPVQIWTPTAPNADNAALGLGIASAGRSLGSALSKLADEHKRKNTQAKAVETFLSTLPEDQMPMDKLAFKNLSADQKIGVGMGLIQSQQFQQGQQQSQLNLAGLARIHQQMQADQDAAANNARSPAFLSALSRYRQPTLETMPPGVEGPPNQMPGLDFSGAAGLAAEETGYQLPTREVGDMLERLLAEEGEGINSLFKPHELGVIRPTSMPGVGYMPTSRGGGQPIIDPTVPQRPAAERAAKVRVVTDEFGDTKIIQEFTPEEFKQQFPNSKVPGGAAGPTPTTPTQSGEIPTVTTQAQFDALPKGSTYIGKDGRKWKKP